MLSFRGGVWRTVNVVLSDPIFSEEHRLQAAAIAATAQQKGLSVQASTAEAERVLYERLYGGLVPRKQHGSPQDQKKQGGVEKKAVGGGGASAVRNG